MPTSSSTGLPHLVRKEEEEEEEEEEVMGPKAFLTAPLSLEGDSETKYRAPNLLQRVLSLMSNVGTGSDLTRMQLPPMFNIPKSQLQCYGESMYCITSDLLSRCAQGETPIERFTSVVAWSISTLRPLIFGVAPYNPILGETHHVSRGNLNVLLEQVSHHPPVTALQATDEVENIETIWWHSYIPKFHGTYIETEVQGRKQLKLLRRNETYIMSSPKLVVRLLPLPGVDWLGDITICCQETGIRAELCFRGNSFLPRPSIHRSIKGKIFLPASSNNAMYEIRGHWDRTVTMKDLTTGGTTIIYDAKEALSGLKTPVVRNPKELSPSESTVVWAEVSEAISKRWWEKAREAKNCLEERQRELASKRKSRGENWIPKYFTVSYNKESGWDCSPNQTLVSPAPILVPLR